MNNSYPAIYLNYTKESLLSYLRQIQYGIEEEGLFSISCSIDPTSFQDSTYASAQASVTGIALGISPERIILMHRKAGPDVCIIEKVSPSLIDEEGRLLGKNAARLVKGLPLYGMK